MRRWGKPSEEEGDGSHCTPSDQGGELVNADIEAVAGAERCAPVDDLLGSSVEDTGRAGRQGAFDRDAVEGFDRIGFAVLSHRHFRRLRTVGRQGAERRIQRSVRSPALSAVRHGSSTRQVEKGRHRIGQFIGKPGCHGF